jgi:hypothetical protein
VLPYVFRVTKYDPADRNAAGFYVGAENVYSDHGPVEAAYLQAVAAFAEDTGVARLAIREPAVAHFVNFGVEQPIDGHGLDGVFPPDLTGYHDGAEVPLADALRLVRAMLRDNGAWCRLEVEGRFLVHVGYDQCLYVGTTTASHRAVAMTHERGLFVERIDMSPWDITVDEDARGERRAADDAFWAELSDLAGRRGSVLLRESPYSGAAFWHRVTTANLATVRASLRPRACLEAWPDLSPQVDHVLATRPRDRPVEVVWEDHAGRIASRMADQDEDLGWVRVDAVAALVASALAEDHEPLAAAVLPDPDGVLRARWAP